MGINLFLTTMWPSRNTVKGVAKFMLADVIFKQCLNRIETLAGFHVILPQQALPVSPLRLTGLFSGLK